VVEYKPDDESILCVDCCKKLKASMSGQLDIKPSGRSFAISINFIAPPPEEKPLPKEVKR
jgi:hypothetical protein